MNAELSPDLLKDWEGRGRVPVIEGRGQDPLGKRTPISATQEPAKILRQIIRHLEGRREGVAASMDLSNRSYFFM